uniref:Uncharacterized protein n=1 Tax=Arundo donax TaxID=35708 RepID=A0A0A9DP48_ARUDO
MQQTLFSCQSPRTTSELPLRPLFLLPACDASICCRTPRRTPPHCPRPGALRTSTVLPARSLQCCRRAQRMEEISSASTHTPPTCARIHILPWRGREQEGG